MKTLEFSNGDQVAALGLGTWKSAPGEVGPAIKEAIRLGYRHIDCAAVYGNEIEIGKALNEVLTEGSIQRDELWITSKLWNDSHAPDDVHPALQKTLADLQLDYLDLYLMHWPVAYRKGISFPESAEEMISLEDLPLIKTWGAMEPLAQQGLCRHLGVSNFSIKKLQSLHEQAQIKPEMNQVELNPYMQQTDLLHFCQQHAIHLTGYAPLGSSGRPPHLKTDDDPVALQDPTIHKISEKHSLTPAQTILAWELSRAIAVIPKSVNAGRLQENLAAAEVTLPQSDIELIDGLDRKLRFFHGRNFAIPGSTYTYENLWDTPCSAS